MQLAHRCTGKQWSDTCACGNVGGVELRPVPPPDEWLPISDAAARLGVVERTLRRWVSGNLLDTKHGTTSNGKPLRLVSLSQVRRLVSEHGLAVCPEVSRKPSYTFPNAVSELEQITAETAQNTAKQATLELVSELQDKLREAQAKLYAAEVVERSTAARCDKLEQKLEKAQKEALSLARALGAAESQRDALQLLPRADAGGGLWGRLFRWFD